MDTARTIDEVTLVRTEMDQLLVAEQASNLDRPADMELEAV